MPKKHQRNGGKDNIAIGPLVRSLEESQITDEKCNLEKAYSNLINGTSRKVDLGVNVETGGGSIRYG